MGVKDLQKSLPADFPGLRRGQSADWLPGHPSSSLPVYIHYRRLLQFPLAHNTLRPCTNQKRFQEARGGKEAEGRTSDLPERGVRSALQEMDLKSEEEVFNSNFFKRSIPGEVEGVPVPGSLEKNWGLLWAFPARPDDLLICTYPKAGTTWIQEIVDMLQQGGDPQKCARAPTHKRMPFIDLFLPKPMTSGLEDAEAMPSPRTLKTHLPIQLLPPSFWEQNCKVIYVARNAKDNAVSYFHFHRMNQMMPDPGNWDQFLEDFLAGKVLCGSWFDHIRGWWKAKDRHPILYLFYEDIKEDPAREIRKVAQFLGIELTEPVLKRIVQHTTFESMKANPMANYSTLPSSFLDQAVSPFMRKGTVGDWKEHFTVAQSEWLDEVCARELEGSGLTFRKEL